MIKDDLENYEDGFEMGSEFLTSVSAVGVVVTNKERDLFYIQQKDDTHPIKSFRLKYTFFGGNYEKEKESKINALKRELYEELDSKIVEIISKSLKEVLEVSHIPSFRPPLPFALTLYESIVSKEDLEKIANYPVKEGNGGFIFNRRDLEKIEFVEGANMVVKKYLEYINN